MAKFNEWQFKQLGCDCIVHRYHVAHLCACGTVLDHSQGTWNRHRAHRMLNFSPKQYKHGWGFSETFDYLSAMGLIDLFAEAYPAVYEATAS